MEDSKIKSLIGGHLLNEMRDIFTESSGIPLCFYNGSLEWDWFVKYCLIFDIWYHFSRSQQKRIYEGKFQSTNNWTYAFCCIKTPKCAVYTSQCHTRSSVQRNICTINSACSNLTPTRLQRFTTR